MTRTAARPIRTIRRSIRAAMRAGQKLVTAVRGSRFRVLVRLFAAIDAGRTVRIGYTDSKGARSVRDITPHRLDTTAAGNITIRAFDWRDREDTTFRADRMTINAEEPAVTEAHPLPSTTQVGSYTITLAATSGPYFAYGVDVHRPTTGDEADLYGTREGASLLSDQIGAHGLEQATADYQGLIAEYEARVEKAGHYTEAA